MEIMKERRINLMEKKRLKMEKKRLKMERMMRKKLQLNLIRFVLKSNKKSEILELLCFTSAMFRLMRTKEKKWWKLVLVKETQEQWMRNVHRINLLKILKRILMRNLFWLRILENLLQTQMLEMKMKEMKKQRLKVKRKLKKKLSQKEKWKSQKNQLLKVLWDKQILLHLKLIKFNPNYYENLDNQYQKSLKKKGNFCNQEENY